MVKSKSQKVLGDNSYVCKSYRGKTGRGTFYSPPILNRVKGSISCILKVECRKSQSVNGPFHKLWKILEKSAKIHSRQSTCMVNMCETCNHVVAEIFQVRAAVRPYLKNPSWTNSANKWLPCRKYIEPAKIKDLKLDREDSAQSGKKKRTLVASP